MRTILSLIFLLFLLVIGAFAQVIGQTDLPDITITEAGIGDKDGNNITGSLGKNEQFYVWWSVKNLGDAASWKYGTRLYIPKGLKWLNAPSYFYSNDKYIDFQADYSMDNLEPGQSKDWHMGWPCYFINEGSYEFRFVVNPRNFVQESNYDNNEYAFTVDVGVVETTAKTTYSSASTPISTLKTTQAIMTTTTKAVVSTETVVISTGLPNEMLYAVIAVVVIAVIGGAFFLMRRKGAEAVPIPPLATPPSTLPEEFKYCQKCGTQLELDMGFCKKCGAEQK